MFSMISLVYVLFVILYLCAVATIESSSTDVLYSSSPNSSQTATTLESINEPLNRTAAVNLATPLQIKVRRHFENNQQNIQHIPPKSTLTMGDKYLNGEKTAGLDKLHNFNYGDVPGNNTIDFPDNFNSENVSSEDDLFGSGMTNEYINFTTESWEFDIQDLQNASVEDIFNSTDNKHDTDNKTSGIALDEIIQQWLLEQHRNLNNRLSDVKIKGVEANGSSLIENFMKGTTELGDVTETNKATDESISTTTNDTPFASDYTESIDLPFVLSTLEHSEGPSSTVTEVPTYTSTIINFPFSTDYPEMELETAEYSTEGNDFLTSTSPEGSTTLDLTTFYEGYEGISTTTDLVPLISTAINQQETTRIVIPLNDDFIDDGESRKSSIMGRLRNENGIICVSLSCTIQIFLNDTPIILPQNMSVVESSNNKQGDMTFNWFNLNNDTVSILFTVQAKEEFYYIDSLTFTISDLDVFKEDGYEIGKELNIHKSNLTLFKTRLGTSLNINRGVLLPIGEGIVLLLNKVRFSAFYELFNVSKLATGNTAQQATPFSDYFVEILVGAVGISLLVIIFIFIYKACRRNNKKIVVETA